MRRSAGRSRPVAEFTWRRVDDVLNPKRGGVLNVRLAGGSKAVLSDQDFLKTYAQYQHWFSPSPVDQFILRAEAGRTFAQSRDGIPEDFLFRAGGSRSVRGYEYESLGARDGDAVVGGRYLLDRQAPSTCAGSRPPGAARVFLDVGDAADASRGPARQQGLRRGGALAHARRAARHRHRVRRPRPQGAARLLRRGGFLRAP